MTANGIIFDVDGTLWDSTDTVAEAWTDAIQHHTQLDMEINAEILKNVFGKTMREIANTLFPTLSDKEKMTILDICYEYENQLLKTKPGKLYDKVYETLKTLSKEHPLFIVSNCQCGYIEVFLKTTGLEAAVQDHLCFGETQTSKGMTIRTLMERRKLRDVVYVGDTQGDYEACMEAGIPFIFASYGFGNAPAAEVRISRISELLELFLLL